MGIQLWLRISKPWSRECPVAVQLRNGWSLCCPVILSHLNDCEASWWGSTGAGRHISHRYNRAHTWTYTQGHTDTFIETHTDVNRHTWRHTHTSRHAYTHEYRQIHTGAYTQKHTKKQIHTNTGKHTGTEHRHYKASLGTYHFYRDPLLPPFASEQYQEAFAKGLKAFVTQWSLVTLFLLVPHLTL